MRRRIAIAAAIPAVLVLGLYVAVQYLLGSDAVRSQIERQVAARLGQPVHIASAGAWIYPRVGVDLRDVTIGDPVVVQLAHVRVATGLRALVSRTIAEAEVEISDGRVTLPLPFSLAPGSPAGAERPGPAASLTIQSIRVISIRNVSLVAGAQALRLDVESALTGDQLEISSLSARAAHTNVEAAGALSSLSRLEGHFDARADPLDLDEMIAIANAMTAPADPEGRGATKAPNRTGDSTLHLTIAMQASAAQFATYTVQDLSTTVDVSAGRVALSPLSLGTFGGRLSGTLAVTTTGRVPQLRLNGRMDGLDMREIMELTGVPGAITGRLAGTVGLTAEGDDSASIMRTAHGTIDAAITDGQLPHLDIVRNVVLAFGKPSGLAPEGAGTAFSRIGGRFSLATGVMTSANLALTSRDVEMRGAGLVRLASGQVEARADVSLSRELTMQAGTDLRRYAQEDGRVVVPATIDGTLARPAVSIDIVAAGRRAIQNELQRRAADWLGGLFKKKKGGG